MQLQATTGASQMLAKVAKSLHIPVLSVTAMKVKLMADHFVKVRAIIKDLISKLEDDAEAEATQKGFCDTNMAAAVSDRDEGNALTTLQEGAANQYSANKKLNLAQKSPTFLQISGTSSQSMQLAATTGASQLLSKVAKDLHSPVLSVTAMKVKLMADHFVKVRAIIKDLISKLEDDAEAEATQKGFCDTNM